MITNSIAISDHKYFPNAIYSSYHFVSSTVNIQIYFQFVFFLIHQWYTGLFKLVFQCLLHNTHLHKTKIHSHIMVQTSQIHNSSGESIDCILYDFSCQKTAAGNRFRVTEYHPKTFLVNTVLTFGFCYFFFAMISHQLVFEFSVRNKTRSDFMDMLSFCSLFLQIFLRVKLGILSRLNFTRFHFKTECSKVLDIDSFAIEDLFFQVSRKWVDDYMELCFRFQWFIRWDSSWLANQMFSWIVLGMFQYELEYSIVIHFYLLSYIMCSYKNKISL